MPCSSVAKTTLAALIETGSFRARRPHGRLKADGEGAEKECSGYGLGPRVRNDVEDKNRSLGFSPGTNVSSALISPVFLRGWGRAGMLGLPFGPPRQE